jgi:PKD repeat protein
MRLETNPSIFTTENLHSWVVIILALILFSSALIIFVPINTIASRQNNAPVAVIDSPENAAIYDPNEIINFDASSSSDPDNDALSYQWNFGDGTSGSGKTTQHSYATPWVPIITLTVDDGDLNDTARVVIIIGTGGGQNRPPSANITEPNNGDTFYAGEIIWFDASDSSDPDEDELTYQWRFGDQNTSTGKITTHSYPDTGSYVVTLIVSDGMFVDTDQIVIRVNNTPPTADAGQDMMGHRYQDLFFDGTNSSDPDRQDSIVNYTWNFAGTYKYGSTAMHSFEEYGRWVVRLTVQDQDGAEGVDDINVTIVNAEPIAVLKITNEDTLKGKDIEFDGSGSYDSDGDIEDYYFTFGDGSETDWITDSIVEHKYPNEGTYYVSLKVRDDMEESSELAEITVTITEKVNQPPTVSITYPIRDDQVAGRVLVLGTASDPDEEPKKVEVKIDEGDWGGTRKAGLVGNTLDWEYDWDTETVEDGLHTITARAYDGLKYSAEQSISVEVNNRPTTYIEVSMKLAPDTTMPVEEVKVSGTAKYDTNVPVQDGNVRIDISETGQSWTTKTNAQGKYTYTFEAPNTPGVYTVNVLVNDGTLQHSQTKKLTVQNPPDLSVSGADIKFIATGDKPENGKPLKIDVLIKNSGDVSATGNILFILDSPGNSPFASVKINVPQGGAITASTTWTAREGNHVIIIRITDTNPADFDEDNNQATKEINVAASSGEGDEEGSQNLIDQIMGMPTIYKYSLVGAILAIITLTVLFAIVKSVKSSEAKKKAEKDRKETGRIGDETVVFQPLADGGKGSKISITAIVVLLLAIVSIVLMALSLFMPWYVMSRDIGDESFSAKYSFDEVEIDDPFNEVTISSSWDSETLEDYEAQRDMFIKTQYLVYLGLIMGIFLLIGAIIATMKKSKKIAVLFGFLAFIFCLLGPVIFMYWHPGAYAEDFGIDIEEQEIEGPYSTFMGTIKQEYLGSESEITWGPGNGWYLAVGGAIVALIGLLVALAIPKPKPTKEAVTEKGVSVDTFRQRTASNVMVVFESVDDEDDETGRVSPSFDSIGIR